MSYKISVDNEKKFRLTISSKNGNTIAFSTKGYDLKTEIFAIIETIENGLYFAEVETANLEINGHAVYFTVYSEDGQKLLISKIYKSQGHRNTFQQVNTSAQKGINSIKKYCVK